MPATAYETFLKAKEVDYDAAIKAYDGPLETLKKDDLVNYVKMKRPTVGKEHIKFVLRLGKMKLTKRSRIALNAVFADPDNRRLVIHLRVYTPSMALKVLKHIEKDVKNFDTYRQNGFLAHIISKHACKRFSHIPRTMSKIVIKCAEFLEYESGLIEPLMKIGDLDGCVRAATRGHSCVRGRLMEYILENRFDHGVYRQTHAFVIVAQMGAVFSFTDDEKVYNIDTSAYPRVDWTKMYRAIVKWPDSEHDIDVVLSSGCEKCCL